MTETEKRQVPEFIVQVYGGDVGGIDEDFEAETEEEAIRLARKYHRKGSRPTEVYETFGTNGSWRLVTWVE